MQLLRRLIVRTRWPMAALAAVVTLLMLLNGWRNFALKFPLGAWNGAARFGYLELRGRGLRLTLCNFGVNFGGAYEFYPVDDGESGWSRFTTWNPLLVVQTRSYIDTYVPLWAVWIPPAALASVGFRAKRWGPRGECARCRYPLKSATVCPECGQSSVGAERRL